MIFKGLHIRILSVVTFMLLFHSEVKSQGTDLVQGKHKKFYVSFNISPVKTSLINTGTDSIADLSSNSVNSLGCSVEAGYFFSSNFGLSAGIGFSTYTGDLTLGNYHTSYDTIDSDNEDYTRLISGSSISETQKISFINIPLALNFRIPLNDKFGFYLQTGATILLPIKNTYSSSGIFTYEGYYPKYNITISDVPFEGFVKDYPNSSDAELKIKSFNADLFASAGIEFSIRKKVQLLLGFTYSKILSDFAEYDQPENFILSSQPDQMKSMMEGSSKVTASSMGFKLSFRYFFK
jgi:hypothetical protein